MGKNVAIANNLMQEMNKFFHNNQEVFDQNIDNFSLVVSLICDESVTSILDLDKIETFVIRKRLGFFDDGIMQSFSSISQSFIRNLSMERTRSILVDAHNSIGRKIVLGKETYLNDKEGSNQIDSSIPINELLYSSIEILNLPTRSFNNLVRLNIKTVLELINFNIETLFKTDGIGPASLKEIISIVHNMGLFFADEAPVLKIYVDDINSKFGNISTSSLVNKYNDLLLQKVELEKKLKNLESEISLVVEQIKSKYEGDNNEYQNIRRISR